MNSLTIITILAGAYQQLTERLKDKIVIKGKSIAPQWVCFIISFITLLLWKDIGLLNVLRPTNYIWDSFITSWFMTLEAGVLNDVLKFIKGAKDNIVNKGGE